jgi:acetyl esterase/lipase
MARVIRRLAASIYAAALLFACVPSAIAQTAAQVVDIPTRPGVTQRFLYLQHVQPKGAVILFAGGNGGLQIGEDGNFGSLRGNFLVRSRQLFADQGYTVAVIDAPSDRQSSPYLSGFRQTPQHAADVKAAIAWLRQHAQQPIWLVGTSRGTQSAAYVAIELGAGGGGPDGIVLTSTILNDRQGRPVPDMPLEKLTMPVLVVHHEQDGCRLCSYNEIPRLMSKLTSASRKDLLTFTGGVNRGDPCEAMAHHGFNGLEPDVVAKIAAWIGR